MPDFLHQKCLPCEGGVEPHSPEKVREYLAVVPGWQATDDFKQIKREFTLKDFTSALKFINQIGDIAEAEGHHPNLELFSWNHVRIVLYTHASGGLSDNDFIIAAKINQWWQAQASAKA